MPVWLQILLAIGIDLGLSVATKSIYESTHQIMPFTLVFQLATSLWAAWDSSKIRIRKYQVPLSFHPALIFVVCMLVWLLTFPLYLFARNKVLDGGAPLKLPSSQSAKPGYAAKLLGFTLFCLLLGGVVLFCLFAPRINPGFINGYLFKDPSEAEDLLISRRIGPKEGAFFSQVAASLQHPLTEDDFRRLELAKPEEVQFKTKDGVTLKGWYFATPQSKETVLFSNDGNFGMRFPVLLGYIKTLQKAQFSVFVYDYRKFSVAGAESNPENVITDGRAAYDYLVSERKIDPQHLILMGRGIGAYVCCQLSKDLPCAGMVLEDPWTNLKDHVDNSLAIAMRLVPLALYPGDGLDNLNVLKGKHPPILIVGSSLHESGPYDIYDAIDGPKTFVRLIKFDMMSFPDLRASSNRYVAKLEKFLQAPKTTPAEAESSAAQNNEPTQAEFKWHTSLEEALAEAKTEKKFVLADFYTTWCGPCKLMDSKTFENGKVQDFLNQHFIGVKIDAEDPKIGIKIAEKYQVVVYPTILILAPNGDVLDKMTGFVPANRFHRALKSVLE